MKIQRKVLTATIICSLGGVLIGGLALHAHTQILQQGMQVEQQHAKARRKISEFFPDAGLADAIREELRKKDTDALVSETQLRSISSLTARSKNISDLTGVEYLLGIQVLDLTNNAIENLDPLEGLKDNKNLSVLKLGENKISNLSVFREFSSLDELNLSSNMITGADAIGGLSNLKRLYLNTNQLTAIPLSYNLTKLEILNMDNNKLTTIDNIEHYEGLRTLSISDNKISNFEKLKNHNQENLALDAYDQKITLSKTELSDKTSLILRDEQGEVPQITSSDVEYNKSDNTLLWKKIGENTAEFESTSGVFTGIITQNVTKDRPRIISIFEDPKIAEEVAKALDEISVDAKIDEELLKSIKKLIVPGKGIKTLVGIERLTDLEVLDLTGNDLTSIDHLETLTNLKTLKIGFMPKVQSYAKLAKLINLEVIDITKTETTSVQFMEKLSKLREVHAEENHIRNFCVLKDKKLSVFQGMSQTFNWKDTENLRTRFMLRDQNCIAPIITSDTATYDSTENVLSWKKAGLNTAEFKNANSTFTGTIKQRVLVKEKTIKDIFKDERLAEEIRKKLKKKTTEDIVTDQDLNSITVLSVVNKQIVSLEGIESLTNLKVLDISYNKIEDITPLKDMKNLKTLIANKNNIRDTQPSCHIKTAHFLNQEIYLESTKATSMNVTNYKAELPLILRGKCGNIPTVRVDIPRTNILDRHLAQVSYDGLVLRWTHLSPVESGSKYSAYFLTKGDYFTGRIMHDIIR